MAKKSSRSRTAASADEEQESNGGNALLSGWYYHGKNYDPRKKLDQQAAKKIFETEGALASSSVKDPAERQEAHEKELQRLADDKTIKGFGTSAPPEDEPEEEGGGGS